MIAIVGYRMGNLGSIRKMLHKIGAKAGTCCGIDEIAKTEKLVLSRVGYFEAADLARKNICAAHLKPENIHKLGFTSSENFSRFSYPAQYYEQ